MINDRQREVAPLAGGSLAAVMCRVRPAAENAALTGARRVAAVGRGCLIASAAVAVISANREVGLLAFGALAQISSEVPGQVQIGLVSGVRLLSNSVRVLRAYALMRHPNALGAILPLSLLAARARTVVGRDSGHHCRISAILFPRRLAGGPGFVGAGVGELIFPISRRSARCAGP